MEWVVTTAKTIDEAKDRALDQLGVAADEAEFEVVEEPKTGLFGRLKVEARVRARVKPTPVRPKQDRRDRRRGGKQRARKGRDDQQGQRQQRQKNQGSQDESTESRGDGEGRKRRSPASSEQASSGSDSSSKGRGDQTDGGRRRPQRQRVEKEKSAMSDEAAQESTVTPQEVGDAAVAFMSGLASAMGAEAETEVTVDGTEIDVRLSGAELGLLVGPGGRTLTAVQDLARVASQRRLGDHDTRLRIDVGGYREKRRGALEQFAVSVADKVIESGSAKALEPMSSADRKAVHDALADVDGVESRSEGDDPNRRVVISPS
jgi:spoIIIJ-associated protein